MARLRLLWIRRRCIIFLTAVGLSFSALIVFLIPKQFEASTRLMPPDTQSTSGIGMLAALSAKTGNDLGTLAGDLLSLKSSGGLFIGMLKSQTVQNRLVRHFDLQKVYGSALAQPARRKLDENTVVTEDRKSGIITVSVTDRSPQRAASLANAYVTALNSIVAELSTSSAHRERVFLEERLETVKQELDAASDELAQFSSQNSTLDIQQQGKAMLDAAAALEGQMIAAQSELEGLRQIYTDNNVRVRSLDARIAELRNELGKLSGTNDHPEKQAGLSLASSREMPYPSIRKLPLLGVKYANYYRRTKIQETVYELLTEQYELAKVEEAKETPSVKVLDQAEIPDQKSSPPRLLLLALGTLLTAALSVVWVVATTRWKEADPQDPRKILVQEIVTTTRAQMAWVNGTSLRSNAQRIWSRLGSGCPPTPGAAA